MPKAIMTATMPTPTPFPTEPRLATALRPIHSAWIRETRRVLAQAVAPQADFWDRWTASKYLTHEFGERYRLERRLVDQLWTLLPGRAAERVAYEGERLRRCRSDLDCLGRRRATAQEMTDASRALVERLSSWLAQVEVAMRGIPQARLTPAAADILLLLETTIAPTEAVEGD